jgi:hypothetical protein
MVSSREWHTLFTFLQLTAASAFAMLATLSSPAYCAVPGSVALARALKNRGIRTPVRKAHGVIGLVAAAAAALAAAWYLKNFEAAVEYGQSGYSFAYAAEVKDLFPLKLAEWTRLMVLGFLASAAIALLFPCAWVVERRDAGRRSGREATTMALLLMQVLAVLLVLASSAHQTLRYLLPLAPYFAMVGTWSLSRIGRNGLRRAAFLVLGLQLAVIHVLMYLWGGGYFARERQRYVAVLEAVTQATSDDAPETLWLGLGEAGVFNFDLEYHRAKSFDDYPGQASNCYSIEARLAEMEGDVEALWKEMEASRGVNIVLLRRPLPPLDRSNPYDNSQRLTQGTRDISSRVRGSPRFERMETPASWEVEVYRDVGGADSPSPLSSDTR